MCGIFAVIHPTGNAGDAEKAFREGKPRGPDHTRFVSDLPVWLGFHRLAINGLDEASSQPLSRDGVHLVCNGEIYNHAKLRETHDLDCQTHSDCEVIVHLYLKYGIHATVQLIDTSEVAFVLYDSRSDTTYVVRDALGVRSLYCAKHGETIVVASEMKMCDVYPNMEYVPLSPGTIYTFRTNEWKSDRYYTLPLAGGDVSLYETMYRAVMKRVRNTDRPMACLLSGGLDSSIVTALVVKCRAELGITEQLETYCIGIEGGEDLQYAQYAAEHLNTKHTNIVLTEDQFFEAIPRVVRAIESYDTTSVRASVGNFLVAEYIKTHSEARVLFNGDGSDELCGGYLYMKHAPNADVFDLECRRLLTDIHLFDALRSDKCISGNGLEPRTPFLDPTVVQAYLSLPPEVRFNAIEKFPLRKAFEHMLPSVICWRKKEAFSDGVSSVGRSWYKVIQSRLPPSTETTLTPEQLYYKSIYDTYYTSILPYYWMPRFVAARDCSARELPE